MDVPSVFDTRIAAQKRASARKVTMSRMANVSPVAFQTAKMTSSSEIRMAAPVGYPSPSPCGPQPSEVAPPVRNLALASRFMKSDIVVPAMLVDRMTVQ
ncbi:hypothetical protein SAMN06272741_6062 [Streptomyces sp. 2114.4]|nr:hypothetical protein SAMN06272741_6062 [Streptomyces sp. 2114.4]